MLINSTPLADADRSPPGKKWQWLVATVIALLPGLRLLHIVLRIHAKPGSRRDFAWIYMAGRSWLSGHSPYDLAWLSHLRAGQDWAGPPPLFWGEHDVTLPFVYPPHWALVAVPAALLPFRVVTTIWDLVSFASFVGLCALCARATLRRAPAFSRPLLLAGAGVAALNGGVMWSLGDCQMDAVPLLAIAGALVVAPRPRSTLLLALLSFIALLKPQIALAPLAYLFLREGRRGVALGALAACVVSLVAMAPSGVTGFPAQYLESTRAHASQPFNAPGSFYNVAVVLDWLFPGNWALSASSLLGIACALALALVEPFASADRMSDPLWRLAVLMGVSVAFFPQHGYGFIAYTPIIFLALGIRPWWLGGTVACLALLASHTKQVPPLKSLPLSGPMVCVGLMAALLYAVTRSARAPRVTVGTVETT